MTSLDLECPRCAGKGRYWEETGHAGPDGEPEGLWFGCALCAAYGWCCLEVVDGDLYLDGRPIPLHSLVDEGFSLTDPEIQALLDQLED